MLIYLFLRVNYQCKKTEKSSIPERTHYQNKDRQKSWLPACTCLCDRLFLGLLLSLSCCTSNLFFWY